MPPLLEKVTINQWVSHRCRDRQQRGCGERLRNRSADRPSQGAAVLSRLTVLRCKLRVIDRLVAIQCTVHGRQGIFESARTVEQHDLLVAADAAISETLLECRVGGGGLRA